MNGLTLESIANMAYSLRIFNACCSDCVWAIKR